MRTSAASSGNAGSGQSPRVSVIMPAYNAAATIAQSIESCLAQTFRDFELLVLDDCSDSNDSTAAIVREITAKDPRVKFAANARNMGVAATRNRGIELAAGEYIALLDADDCWHTDKLAKQLAFMQEKSAVISYTATAYMDSEGQRLPGYILAAKEQLRYGELLRHNIMSASSVMFRRDAADGNLFAEGYLHEDYLAWLRIVEQSGCAHGLNEPLLSYRMHKGSKSANRISSARMLFNTYRKLGFSRVRAALMCVRYTYFSVGKRFFIFSKIPENIPVNCKSKFRS